MTGDERLATLLRYLAENGEVSAARVARQLAWSHSELHRIVAILGDDTSIGGLGLITERTEGARCLLCLSERGKAWLLQHA